MASPDQSIRAACVKGVAAFRWSSRPQVLNFKHVRGRQLIEGTAALIYANPNVDGAYSDSGSACNIHLRAWAIAVLEAVWRPGYRFVKAGAILDDAGDLVR